MHDSSSNGYPPTQGADIGVPGYGVGEVNVSYAVKLPADGHVYATAAVPPLAGTEESSLPDGYKVSYRFGVLGLVSPDGSDVLYLKQDTYPFVEVDPAAANPANRLVFDWAAPDHQEGSDLTPDATNKWVASTAGGVYLVNFYGQFSVDPDV